jgi:hypothetical protein
VMKWPWFGSTLKSVIRKSAPRCDRAIAERSAA